jgi:hypothetical protein
MMCRHLIVVAVMITRRITHHVMVVMRHACMHMRGSGLQATGAQSNADRLQDEREEGKKECWAARDTRGPLRRSIVFAFSHAIAPYAKRLVAFRNGGKLGSVTLLAAPRSLDVSAPPSMVTAPYFCARKARPGQG